ALVELMGEPGEMVLLAVVAGHAILAAADGYADMSHDQVSLRSTNTTSNATSALIGLDDVTDRGHRLVEAPRRLPVVVLQHPRMGLEAVEFGRESRPVQAEIMNLFGERAAAAVGLEPHLHGRIERIQRSAEALDGLLDGEGVAHIATSG